jgi:hypothetical protein
MTVSSASSSSLLQQIQSLNSTLESSSTGQTSAVSNFMQALEQVLTAGEQILSANLTQTSGSSATSTGTSSDSSSSSSSTTGTDAATVTSMLATAQAAQPSVYTPTTDWSQASWDTSPYDAANNAASSGVSQTVNGVQIIPGAPGWNANSSALQGIYSGIQSTWDNEASLITPQNNQSSTGTNNWSNSPYDAANGAAAQGVSQLVNGVQVIPGAPGWDPNNPSLQSVYAGMQSTWSFLNSTTPTSS